MHDYIRLNILQHAASIVVADVPFARDAFLKYRGIIRLNWYLLSVRGLIFLETTEDSNNITNPEPSLYVNYRLRSTTKSAQSRKENNPHIRDPSFSTSEFGLRER